jgi:putative N6-adenine-specific DNA methylase
LVDPFCGSGTIPIEAALIGLNVAPGLKRDFASGEWPNIPGKYWKDAREEAFGLIRTDKELRIHGSDIDDEAMSLARYHAKEAGVDAHMHLQRMDMRDVHSRYKYGCIITNPPYGERLGETKQIERLYKRMGQKFMEFDTWSWYIIASHPEFERFFGRRADKKRKLYNGRLQCCYYRYFGPPPPKNY